MGDDSSRRVGGRGQEADDLQTLGDPTPWMRDPEWLPVWMHRTSVGTREDDGDQVRRRQQEQMQEHAQQQRSQPQAAAASSAAATAQDVMDVDEGHSDRAAMDARGSGGDGGMEHVLLHVGPMVFCSRCGAYALSRVGARLAGQCIKTSSRATRRRLDRMRQGLHPITGDPVT